VVEVRFACIPSVAGVKCTLDGAVKYSDSLGLASFFGISQGAHTYSVEAPAGWKFDYGEGVFGDPIPQSGTTVIEWAELPGTPWPEDQPWMMKFIFIEEAVLGEFRFDSWNPLVLDFREIFIVGSAWPAVVRPADVGENIYAHYVVKNVGAEAGEATITVKDLDTGSVITTWSSPELATNERFKTSGSGAYIGKMPNKEWRLEFKVTP